MGTGSLSLLDYRRRTAQLYGDVRATARRHGAPAAHALWRDGRDRLVAEHADSPLPPGDPRRRTGLPVARYHPDLRWVLDLEPDDDSDDDGDDGDDDRGPARGLSVATGTDGVVGYRRLGHVSTPLGSLDVWWLTGYGGGVWLPVRDGSCDGQGPAASYGGGRYLLDTVKGADLGSGADADRADRADRAAHGSLVVDLNFLYNPSCAYDPVWACPLPPPGNRLGVAVAAGELSPG